MDKPAVKKRLLSGMQPTGTGALHLGNLEGALRNWVRLQNDYEMFCCIVDWHALTTMYDRTEGIAEASLYVAREARGRGAGRVALSALIEAAEEAGFWKLLSRIFVENQPSRRLVRAMGFREVGVYEKHGQLDGVWRDVVIVERLIPKNLR